ncbi:hypothetical protein IFM89_024086 [Coptis chinensis]|uniref:Uncharacterized protein n=1 Tax=Coptis chinensis TaxID=261450 RepID=A0A835LSV0_9MAGN|nr:hypothetical protein IFM89_024086 [Coptis chinensis]
MSSPKDALDASNNTRDGNCTLICRFYLECLRPIILMVSIDRCKTGKHTTEKLVITKVVSTTMKPIPSPLDSASSKAACSRCKQGFLCSEHGIEKVLILFLCALFIYFLRAIARCSKEVLLVLLMW